MSSKGRDKIQRGAVVIVKSDVPCFASTRGRRKLKSLVGKIVTENLKLDLVNGKRLIRCQQGLRMTLHSTIASVLKKWPATRFVLRAASCQRWMRIYRCSFF